jgi:hypothetical protein
MCMLGRCWLLHPVSNRVPEFWGNQAGWFSMLWVQFTHRRVWWYHSKYINYRNIANWMTRRSADAMAKATKSWMYSFVYVAVFPNYHKHGEMITHKVKWKYILPENSGGTSPLASPQPQLGEGATGIRYVSLRDLWLCWNQSVNLSGLGKTTL